MRVDGTPPPTWKDGGGGHDLNFPQDCTTKLPSDPGDGDCSKLASWSCINPCGDFHRLACVKNGAVARELRCNSNGQCQCKIGSEVTVCLGILNNGRMGCTHAREVFEQGCCKP
jgi:hypothetical protein